MRRFAVIMVLAALVAGALAAAAAAYQYRAFVMAWFSVARGSLLSQEAIDAVVAWSVKQGVPPGRVRSAKLPPTLARLTGAGSATIARLRDGRTCVLVVTVLGYKDNFDGVLACTGALTNAELVRSDNYPLTYVSLPGYAGFEELYVRDKRNDRTYDVYFDLN